MARLAECVTKCLERGLGTPRFTVRFEELERIRWETWENIVVCSLDLPRGLELLQLHVAAGLLVQWARRDEHHPSVNESSHLSRCKACTVFLVRHLETDSGNVVL